MGARRHRRHELDEQLQETANLAFFIGGVSEIFSPLVSVAPGELLGIHAFARWGSEPSFASSRDRQLMVGRRLTRER